MNPKQPDELTKGIAFFSDGGLSEENDGLEITICFDYELARESADVVDIVLESAEPEQKAARLLKRPRIARWAGSGGVQYGSSKEVLHGEEEVAAAPLVPTICLAAAKWFPKPWLTIPFGDRKRLVQDFAPVYNTFEPLSISEGHDSPERIALYAKAVASDKAYGYHFKVYTMYLDWSEPLTRLKQRFATWLKQNQPHNIREDDKESAPFGELQEERIRAAGQDDPFEILIQEVQVNPDLSDEQKAQTISALKEQQAEAKAQLFANTSRKLDLGIRKRSHRGHHKPAELLWALTYYRLAKWSVAKRQIMGWELGKEISASQISRGKRRIQELMKSRNYLR
jgi:hypothetical protein